MLGLKGGQLLEGRGRQGCGAGRARRQRTKLGEAGLDRSEDEGKGKEAGK